MRVTIDTKSDSKYFIVRHLNGELYCEVSKKYPLSGVIKMIKPEIILKREDNMEKITLKEFYDLEFAACIRVNSKQQRDLLKHTVITNKITDMDCSWNYYGPTSCYDNVGGCGKIGVYKLFGEIIYTFEDIIF